MDAAANQGEGNMAQGQWSIKGLVGTSVGATVGTMLVLFGAVLLLFKLKNSTWRRRRIVWNNTTSHDGGSSSLSYELQTDELQTDA